MNAQHWRRRSQLAFGVAVICGLFLTETAVAHRTTPSPHSWLVWTLLGGIGGGALVVAAFCRWRAGRA